MNCICVVGREVTLMTLPLRGRTSLLESGRVCNNGDMRPRPFQVKVRPVPSGSFGMPALGVQLWKPRPNEGNLGGFHSHTGALVNNQGQLSDIALRKPQDESSTSHLPATVWDPDTEPYHSTPITMREWNDSCCFKPPSFGVIRYIAIEN